MKLQKHERRLSCSKHFLKLGALTLFVLGISYRHALYMICKLIWQMNESLLNETILRRKETTTIITTKTIIIRNRIMMMTSRNAKTRTITGIITNGNAMITTVKPTTITGTIIINLVATVDMVDTAVTVDMVDVVDVVVVMAVEMADVAVAIILMEAKVVDTKAQCINIIISIKINIRISHQWDRYSMIIIIMVAAHMEDLGPISLALLDGCRPTMVMAVGVNRQ
jgi:hypothetical protein